MLGSHDEAICVPESQFKVDLVRSRGSIPPSTDMASVAEEIAGDFRFRLWGLPLPQVPKQGQTYQHFLAELVRQYAAKIEKPRARIWVDHTPTNLRDACILAKMFPGCRFIHLVRDGRGVAASVIPLDWGPNTIKAAAAWWTSRLSHGFALELSLYQPRVARIHYEDLVLGPGNTLRRICEWLGVSFQPQMVEGSGFVIPKYSSKQHRLIGNRPDPSRVDEWKRRLSQREIEIFESEVGDLLELLGYEPTYGWRPRPLGRWELASQTLVELWRTHLKNRLTQRARGWS